MSLVFPGVRQEGGRYHLLVRERLKELRPEIAGSSYANKENKNDFYRVEFRPQRGLLQSRVA